MSHSPDSNTSSRARALRAARAVALVATVGSLAACGDDGVSGAADAAVADSGEPCRSDGGSIDIECCEAMGYPAGCAVVGPFVPPAMC